MTERQQVKSSTAWRPPPRMSGGRQLTGGKAVREAAGLMQIAAGVDLAIQRQERVGRGIEVPDREVYGRPSARPSSAECSRDKPPFSFVIVWDSPQRHRSVSVSRHFLLQAPQCPCSVRKRFSRDRCCRGRSKPGCRIVGSHTRWELTTWADRQ